MDCSRTNLSVDVIEQYTKQLRIPFTWREVGKKKMCEAIAARLNAVPSKSEGKTPKTVRTKPKKPPAVEENQHIFDSLLLSDRSDKLNAKQTIDGVQYAPVRYAGRWRSFIQHQKETMRLENTGSAPLFTKRVDPLLSHVDTLFFGDSYARMLDPPPRNVYVVSYPGIPLKSITRSFTKASPQEVDKRKTDWIDTHTLSHEAKKKKVFLTFASPLKTLLSKKMFHNFEDMHSYPRVDMIREMLRFPSSTLKALVFWFGNAELQHTFYYDLFKDVPDGPEDYERFVQAYLKQSVAAYIRFLQTVAKLEPTSVLVVLLMNYSPVRAREMPSIVPVKNIRSYPRDMLDYVFSDTTRYRLVDAFNTMLTRAVRSTFPTGRIKLVDVNPLIFDAKLQKVHPEFVLHPKDIYLADPHRKLYRYIARELSY